MDILSPIKYPRASEMRNSFRISRRIGSAAQFGRSLKLQVQGEESRNPLRFRPSPVVLFLNPQFTSQESLHRALAPIGRNLQQNSRNDNTSFHDFLRIGWYAFQVHDVADQRNDQRADHCFYNISFAACKTCAADDAGCDRIKFAAFSKRR